MNSANPIHLILFVAAALLFAGAAFLWPPVMEPYRTRFIAGGLMCLTLTLIF